MDISVIIPVYREKTTINELIDNIKALKGYSGEKIEIIVSACEPGAFREIREPDVLCICSRKGRAAQMNNGALLARGNVLFFLHADTCPPKDALNFILDTCFKSGYKAGAFSLSIGSTHVFLRLVSLVSNLRCLLNRIPYGDQGQFFLNDYFNELGGYREMPLFEDVEIMKRIRKSGEKIRILPQKITASSRRWKKEGMFCCTLRNRFLSLLYTLGFKPEALSRLYPDAGEQPLSAESDKAQFG
jgi:rSAM/selenodomain-associated transferase 2